MNTSRTRLVCLIMSSLFFFRITLHAQEIPTLKAPTLCFYCYDKPQYKIVITQDSRENAHYTMRGDVNSSNDDTLGDRRENLWVGVKFGSHSTNLSGDPYAFERGFYGAATIEIPISNAIDFVVSLSYWQARMKEVITPRVQQPSSFINNKSLKIALNFKLFRVGSIAFALGPSVGVESMNKAVSHLVSLDVTARLYYYLWHDKVRLSSEITYQKGGELNIGGGYDYSFVVFAFGLTANLKK